MRRLTSHLCGLDVAVYQHLRGQCSPERPALVRGPPDLHDLLTVPHHGGTVAIADGEVMLGPSRHCTQVGLLRVSTCSRPVLGAPWRAVRNEPLHRHDILEGYCVAGVQRRSAGRLRSLSLAAGPVQSRFSTELVTEPGRLRQGAQNRINIHETARGLERGCCATGKCLPASRGRCLWLGQQGTRHRTPRRRHSDVHDWPANL